MTTRTELVQCTFPVVFSTGKGQLCDKKVTVEKVAPSRPLLKGNGITQENALGLVVTKLFLAPFNLSVNYIFDCSF